MSSQIEYCSQYILEHFTHWPRRLFWFNATVMLWYTCLSSIFISQLHSALCKGKVDTTHKSVNIILNCIYYICLLRSPRTAVCANARRSAVCETLTPEARLAPMSMFAKSLQAIFFIILMLVMNYSKLSLQHLHAAILQGKGWLWIWIKAKYQNVNAYYLMLCILAFSFKMCHFFLYLRSVTIENIPICYRWSFNIENIQSETLTNIFCKDSM